MKKLIVIVAAVLLIQNWGDIKAFFYPRQDASYSNDTGVVLFTTSWCSACKQAKAFLNQKGVAYLEYDVEKSPEARRQFEALGGRGVPLMVIDGTVVKGFNPNKMRQLLE